AAGPRRAGEGPRPARPAPCRPPGGTIRRVMEPGPRQVLGLVFRGLRMELDRRGLTDRVLERLQGDARPALEHPPMHGAWGPAAPHDQIIQAIADEAGRRAVRDVIYMLARNTTGPVALPLMRTFLNLFGFAPTSLLNNLEKITSLHMRGGIHRGYEAETERS